MASTESGMKKCLPLPGKTGAGKRPKPVIPRVLEVRRPLLFVFLSMALPAEACTLAALNTLVAPNPLRYRVSRLP